MTDKKYAAQNRSIADELLNKPGASAIGDRTALLELVEIFESSAKIPRHLYNWLSAGFLNCANGDFETLDEALGLSVGQGGKTKMIRAFVPRHKRNCIIRELGRILSAISPCPHVLIAAALVDIESADNWPVEAVELINELLESFEGIPLSPKMIGKILKMEVK